MNKYKYISTTLPYINSTPHIGHCFEFVLADVIAEFYRLDHDVVFNVGIDEHGQKVWQKALDEGYLNTQEYCNVLSEQWKQFCSLLKINYDNFYRTTDQQHKENVLTFYKEIESHIFSKEYEGNYCVGCEAFVTDKESNEGRCKTHNTELIFTKEKNKFFDLQKFSSSIEDVLVDKGRSNELLNIIQDKFDLSITRQNVKWGIDSKEGIFYVWAEALLNYIFALKYYENREYFYKFWEDSLIICGKDNLKFQAYILQALLISNKVPQTKEVLVHGNILDADGAKMSKTTGNVIDPVEQVRKYGIDSVRYYLIFGLNTFDDSKYSELDLIKKWNNEIVNGLGNLISRLFHLIDLKKVKLNIEEITEKTNESIENNHLLIKRNFKKYNLREVGSILYEVVNKLNKRITIEKPFDKDCINYFEILNDIYFELEGIMSYYNLVLKHYKPSLDKAFVENKKIIIFEKL